MARNPKELRLEVVRRKTEQVSIFRDAYSELFSSVEGMGYCTPPVVSISQFFDSFMFAVGNAIKLIPEEDAGKYLCGIASHLSRFVCDEMYLSWKSSHIPKEEYLVHARKFACHMRKVMEVKDNAYNGENVLISNVVHSDNVGAYARRIALEIGLTENEVEEVEIAGILHDVGKIGLPDRIIAKPGPLTPEEMEIITSHPEYSARIVRGAGFSDIADLVLMHHMRYDGSGYPESAAARSCPSNPKYAVLPIADTFDAVSHGRPYRQGLGPEGAMEVLKKSVGTQLHPAIVGMAVSRVFLIE